MSLTPIMFTSSDAFSPNQPQLPSFCSSTSYLPLLNTDRARTWKLATCTAEELNDPDTFLSLVKIFSLGIDNNEGLLKLHKTTSSTEYNKNPRTFDKASFDFDEAEELVW